MYVYIYIYREREGECGAAECDEARRDSAEDGGTRSKTIRIWEEVSQRGAVHVTWAGECDLCCATSERRDELAAP